MEHFSCVATTVVVLSVCKSKGVEHCSCFPTAVVAGILQECGGVERFLLRSVWKCGGGTL